jgi:hypothetical protein
MSGVLRYVNCEKGANEGISRVLSSEGRGETMTTKTIVPILVAALSIAVAAPATAKKQTSEQVYTTQKANKKAERRSGENCFLKAPPFMYNPRSMNRGFFKRKCRAPR